ncbi:MAG TPA: hypothetical protein VIL69_23340, partial [Roseomonas sp.]
MTLRRGPRPLPAHLTLAMGRAWLALASIPSHPTTPSTSGSTPWNVNWPGFAPRSVAGKAERDRILRSPAAADPDALRAAVWRRLWQD